MRHHDHNVATTQVWLWRDHRVRPQARCDCGWSGKPRWFAAMARDDAWTHTIRTGHVPAQPIDRWKANTRSPWWLWTTAAGTIIGSALYFSVPAHADPASDTAYIQTLDRYGVTYSTEAAVIDTGHAICRAFDSGMTFPAVLRVAVGAGLDPIDASYLIGAAVGSYCDQFGYLLRTTPGSVAA